MLVILIVISFLEIVTAGNDTHDRQPKLCFGLTNCVHAPNCTNCTIEDYPDNSLPYGARLGMIIGTVFVLLIVVISIIWCYILSRRITRMAHDPIIIPPTAPSLLLSEYSRASIQKSIFLLAQQKNQKKQGRKSSISWNISDSEPTPGTSAGSR